VSGGIPGRGRRVSGSLEGRGQGGAGDRVADAGARGGEGRWHQGSAKRNAAPSGTATKATTSTGGRSKFSGPRLSKKLLSTGPVPKALITQDPTLISRSSARICPTKSFCRSCRSCMNHPSLITLMCPSSTILAMPVCETTSNEVAKYFTTNQVTRLLTRSHDRVSVKPLPAVRPALRLFATSLRRTMVLDPQALVQGPSRTIPTW
jgi:hypothetical protein